MGGCLDESAVLEFLGGTLTAPRRAEIESHLGTCGACADLVTWAAADHRQTTRLPGHEGRPFVGQLQPGSRVGRYQVLGAVGRGGMGEVYAAYHPDLDRRIALKVVYEVGGGSEERRVRLLREARAIARLSHPNVVAVNDAGTFDDRVFIAMEYVDGATVDVWLRAVPRTWRQILDVFMAAGRGLAAAHAAGVVHRDFKPQNVMIAKDGAVRVMDFGLARMAGEAQLAARDANADGEPSPVETVTKTGAFIGTPAYMSPEQFRREPPDARADQFSFCVALHEALYGARPDAATADRGGTLADASVATVRGGVPGWLRSVVARGASPEKEKRYPSMDALLAALDHGRARPRRRAIAVSAGLAVLLVAGGAWRVARGNRFVCAIPSDRLAAAWAAGNPTDPRRQSIHRAFANSGRPAAETSWQRASAALDDYIGQWSAMYMQGCEATHVRGEQSTEVLDLRMSCLNDNLDQVRALTDALTTGDRAAISHAVTAALDLTPVSRCAEIALLRSAVPLPKDDRTLREVQRLRRSMAEMQLMVDLGNLSGVLNRANALRSDVEATRYQPLLGELLNLIGLAESGLDNDGAKGEATLREAMVVAEASKDDATAAKIAINLVYVVGYRLGRFQEAEFWARLANAILDRIGTGQERTRSWLLGNLGGARVRAGDFEGARVLAETALTLKEQSLGKEHPDVAASLSDLAYILSAGGHPAPALIAANRAVEIIRTHGDPGAYTLTYTYSNQGDALLALGRYAEAESAYESSLKILPNNVDSMHPECAFALHGLGSAKLARGAPDAAIPLLETALRIRRQPHEDPVLAADTEFVLARALRIAGDQKRARSLAVAALKTYAEEKRPTRERAVEAWLADRSKR